MFNESSPVGGRHEGSTASDAYKRAVLQPAPARFEVEVLPPTKNNGNYNHGMRITQLSSGDRSSNISTSSLREYEVWRRWEDCLWWQDVLEDEYQRLARSKRVRLLRGKGVKKGDFYQQDRASSWESLPPGPDPSSVALDLHDCVPRLTKRGTIFRPNQATLDQRSAELKNFIDALFREDQPALICDIRASRLNTDFFSFWYRDQETAVKLQKSPEKPPRSSVSSSVFSSYFSASTSTLPIESTPISKSPSMSSPSKLLEVFRRREPSEGRRPSTSSSISSQPGVSSPNRRRALSVSSDSSSAQSSRSSDSCTISNVPTIADEVPIVFGHNPQLTPNFGSDGNVILEALPEDCEVAPKFAPTRSFSTPTRQPQPDRQGNGSVAPSRSSTSTERTILPEDRTLFERSVRESWQTTASNSTILAGLGVSLPGDEQELGHRASMASIATYRTDCSAEGVLPRIIEPQFGYGDRPFEHPISVPIAEEEEDHLDSDTIGAFPRPISFLPVASRRIPIPTSGSRPHTPLRIRTSPSPSPSFNRPMTPPSPTMSTSSHITSLTDVTSTTITTNTTFSSISSALSPTSPGTLSIKAAHNNAIIILRVTRDVSLVDLRARLYSKFVGQEGIPLSQAFTIAFIPHLAQPPNSSGKRPGSSKGLLNDQAEMKLISDQESWEQAVLSVPAGAKVVLKVLNTTL